MGIKRIALSPRSRVTLGLGVFVLVGVIASFRADLYWLRMTTYALNYAVVAMSWDLLLGYSGQVTFASAAVWGVGGYTASVLAQRAGVDPWLAWPVAGIAGVLLGLILAVPAFRLRRIYLALFTLSFGELLRLVAVNEDWLTKGPVGISLSKVRFTGLMADAAGFQILTLTFLVVVYVALRALTNSRVGLYLQAMRDDQEAAEARGIDTRRAKVLVFVVASAVMGLAGGLFAFHNRYVSPDMLHLEYSLQFVVMSLFGGVGTLTGAIVGAISITALMEAMRGWEYLRFVLLGIIVAVNVLLLPQGIVGAITEFVHYRRSDAALRARFGPAGRRPETGIAPDSGDEALIGPGGERRRPPGPG